MCCTPPHRPGKMILKLRGMLDELKTVKKVEILPYHSLGLFNWQNLGIPYTLEVLRLSI